ncbi:MAG TPA: 16S rRNA (guanine(527)-N(7))-methyltransferase RsmG [Allosphingosinicella sp.]|nr:16S rRNA (guanine(527)-N(7))-methyltransferase RsmG [Allosphingosinicella sp.]
MDEGDARAKLGVSRETLERLDAFAAFLLAENERQNLVSRGTLQSVWARHILDSAQLVRFPPAPDASWVDLGTGAGFPGLIVALLHPGSVALVEERKKRAEFLCKAAEILGITGQVAIHCTRVERFESQPFDVISARAFAPLERLFELSHRFSTTKTRWILPKGRNAASELEAAKASWHGEFRLEQSLTDPDAKIIVAEGVRPAGQPRGKAAR